jgi:hypothetical protein
VLSTYHLVYAFHASSLVRQELLSQSDYVTPLQSLHQGFHSALILVLKHPRGYFQPEAEHTAEGGRLCKSGVVAKGDVRVGLPANKIHSCIAP